MRRLSVRVLPALLLGLSLGLLLDGQETTPASGFPLRTFFSVRSAQPDDTIPDILREQFEKDDGSPLRSVAVDLDGDGRNEKFVLCGVPRASGGYQWLVYDVARGVGRGIVVGTIIFIGQERDGGYPRLESYWKQGGEMSVIFRYAFAKSRYSRSGTWALTPWETSEFFRAKPPLDFERELVEIK